MGWKTFYKVDQSYFNTLYANAQLWGDLITYKLTWQGIDYYGAGYFSNTSVLYKFSPKINITWGSVFFQAPKIRITTKVAYIADANSSGSVDYGIVFYKDGDTAKDTAGNDFHGIKNNLSNTSTTLAADFKVVVYEVEGNTLKVYADGTQYGSYQLETPLTSFRLAISLQPTAGWVGMIIYEVEAQYYDYMEDLMVNMMNMMNTMMWAFIALMVINMIISLFKRRGEKK
jgi:hypothetical protein